MSAAKTMIYISKLRMKFTSWTSDISNSYSLLFHVQRGEGAYIRQAQASRYVGFTMAHSEASQLSSLQPSLVTELNWVSRIPLCSKKLMACRKETTEENTACSGTHFSAVCFSWLCECTRLVSLDPILLCGGGRWGLSSHLIKTRKPPSCCPNHLVVYCCGFHSSPSLKETKQRAKCHSDVLQQPSPSLQIISKEETGGWWGIQ